MEPSSQQTPPAEPPLATTQVVRPQVTAGTLISRSFSVWWKNIGKFAVMQLIAMLPVVLLSFLVALVVAGTGRYKNAWDLGTPAGVGLVVAIGALCILIALSCVLVQLAGITHGVVQHLAGHPVRIGAMMSQGIRSAWPLFLACLLMLPAVLGGYLLLVVPGIMIAIAEAATVPVVVAERLGPVAAFKRSLFLTRGHRWSIFAVFAVAGAVQFGANLAGNLLAATMPIVGILVVLLATVLCSSLSLVVPGVVYHDLRVAKEGADTAALVRVFE